MKLFFPSHFLHCVPWYSWIIFEPIDEFILDYITLETLLGIILKVIKATFLRLVWVKKVTENYLSCYDAVLGHLKITVARDLSWNSEK